MSYAGCLELAQGRLELAHSLRRAPLAFEELSLGGPLSLPAMPLQVYGASTLHFGHAAVSRQRCGRVELWAVRDE